MSRFLRAPVVSEFHSRERGPLFWKMYTALTWGATLIGGGTMFFVDYAGNSRGEHVFKSAQDWVKMSYENAVLSGGRGFEAERRVEAERREADLPGSKLK